MDVHGFRVPVDRAGLYDCEVSGDIVQVNTSYCAVYAPLSPYIPEPLLSLPCNSRYLVLCKTGTLYLVYVKRICTRTSYWTVFATSRRLLPRVTTAVLIVWQSTRHLVAESRYPGKMNIMETMSLSTVHLTHYERWAGGMVCFFLASFYFVVLL